MIIYAAPHRQIPRIRENSKLCFNIIPHKITNHPAISSAIIDYLC